MYHLLMSLLVIFMIWLPFVIISERFDKDKRPFGERFGMYTIIYFVSVASLYGFISLKM